MRSLPFFVVAVASTVVVTSSVSADSVSRVQARAGTSAAPLGWGRPGFHHAASPRTVTASNAVH